MRHETPFYGDGYPLSLTEFDFFEYLQLEFIKKPIKTRACSVMIQGSKCSICKREFKCITDTKKHMRKKHKYVKRKADDKLVRIKLKIGKETFCDNTISKKFLITPERRFNTNNDADDEDDNFRGKNDSQPLRVSSTQCPHKIPSNNVNRKLYSKLSVPLCAALVDIKSLDKNARYKNGRIYKEQSSLVEEDFSFATDSKNNNSSLNSKNVDSNSATDSRNKIHSANDAEFDSVTNSGYATKDKEYNSDETWDLNSDSVNDSDSATVIYLSDVEKDLSEFYEDIKLKVENLQSDVEDAETVIMSNEEGDDSLDVRLEDLEEITPEDLDALGKTCEDMDMADVYNRLRMDDNGLDNLENIFRNLDKVNMVNSGPKESDVAQKGSRDRHVRRSPIPRKITQKYPKDVNQKPSEVEVTVTDVVQKRPAEADIHKRYSTEVNHRQSVETEVTQRRLSEADVPRKRQKEAEMNQKNQNENSNSRKKLKKTESKDTIDIVTDFADIIMNFLETAWSGSRSAESTRRTQKAAETSQKRSKKFETVENDSRDKNIGIQLKRTEVKKNSRKTKAIQESGKRMKTSDEKLRDPVITEMLSGRPDISKTTEEVPNIIETIPKTSDIVERVPNIIEKPPEDFQITETISDDLQIIETFPRSVRKDRNVSKNIENQSVNPRAAKIDQNFIETNQTSPEIIETYRRDPKVIQSVRRESEEERIEKKIKEENIIEIFDGLDTPGEDFENRIEHRSLENVENVKRRLEASENSFVDLTENEEDGAGLEASELTFSLVIQNSSDKTEKTEEEDDVIIIDDDDDNNIGKEEQSQFQLEEFLQAAVTKYVRECNASSNSQWDGDSKG